MATIHLGRRLPAASSDQPGSGTGRPMAPCSVLLQVRFTAAGRSPGRWWALTPPFHPYRDRERHGGMFLWHCLEGFPYWALPSTLPYGARTFLVRSSRTRPPSQLEPPYPIKSRAGCQRDGQRSLDPPNPPVQQRHGACCPGYGPYLPCRDKRRLRSRARSLSPRAAKSRRSRSCPAEGSTRWAA